MSRAPYLIVWLLLSGLTVAAQDRLDSLLQALKKADSDSVRFELLYNLSTAAEFTDFIKAKQFAADAIPLADQLGPWAKGKLYLRLAYLETMEGDYAGALQYDLQSAKLFADEADSMGLARACVDIGTDYRDLGEFGEAYTYLTQGFRIIRSYSKPLANRDSLLLSISLHNMGTVFTDLEQFDLAFKHLAASEKMSKVIGDVEGPAYTRYEMGDMYCKKGEYDQAEDHLKEALTHAKDLKIRFLLPRVYLHLAKLYYHKADYPRALAFYDSVRLDPSIANNRFRIAECDLGAGQVMQRQKKYAEALKLLQGSLDVALQLNARNLAMSCYKSLSSLHEQQKEFEKALAYRHQYEELRESLFSKSTMERILQTGISFATFDKDLEIEALSQARELQELEMQRKELIQNILVVVAVLAIILLYSVYRSGRRRKRINRLLMEHQEEIKRRSLELEQLNQVKDKFFSIISHDLRSPMTALGGTLDLLDKKNITPEEFSNLTQALRVQFNHTRALINNLLDWTLLQMDKLKVQHESVNLARLTDESFEALRTLYPKNLLFENRVDPHLTGFGDPNIVNLVLRNLILNAIKFTESGGRIWVDAHESAGEIVVSVSDNGMGIKPEVRDYIFTKTSSYTSRGTANEKGTGLGLILCKEFVEKNGGRIWFESKVGEGSTFSFTLPKAAVAVAAVPETIPT